MHVLVETGQIEAILALCGQEKEGGDRASLLVAWLRSPRVIAYFADRNQWDSYLDWLRRANDADEQRRILPDFTVRPETLVPLVAGGRFEGFLGAVQPGGR